MLRHLLPALLTLPLLVLVTAPPSAAQRTTVRVCVVDQGELRGVVAHFDPATGDTTVTGRPFSRVFPATSPPYAAGTDWYLHDERITVGGRRYFKFGLPRVLGTNEVVTSGAYEGVPVFAERGVRGTPDIVYVPVRPGCEFQPYEVVADRTAVQEGPRPAAQLLAESLAMFSPTALQRVAQVGYRPAERLMHETFEDNRAGWCERNDGGVFLGVRNGRFHIRDAGGSRWCRKQLPENAPELLIRAEVRYESGRTTNGAGIFFRNAGWDEPRPFVIVDAAEDGGLWYEVGYFDRTRPSGERFVKLVPWTRSENLRSGTNVIELVVTGRSMSLLLNGIFERSVSGLPTSSGEYAGVVVAASGVEYSVDDLVIVALEPDA